MSDDWLEARVERTLRHVADRLPERAGAVPAPATATNGSHRRTWLIAAAAIVVVATVGGVLVMTGDGDEGVPVATRGASRTVLTAQAEVGGRALELRLETTATKGCVRLVIPEPMASPEPAPACLGENLVAVGARSRADKTLVYGIASRGARVTGTVEEVATAEVHQAPLDSGIVFIFVINAGLASGTVSVHDTANATIATASFERGGPARPPRGTIGSQTIDFAYLRHGAIWVRTTGGDDIRISDGTDDASDGYPFVLPDRHSVAHTVATRDAPFDAVIATDARDGSTRDLELAGIALLSLSPDRNQIAATVISDDSGAPSELLILNAEDFSEVSRVTLGSMYDVGVIWSAAWNFDSTGLLVETHCCWADPPREQLWYVQPGPTPTTTLMASDEQVTWSLTETAIEQEAFPAIRRTNEKSELGLIRIGESGSAWEPHATLALDGDLWIDARAATDDYIVGNGDHVYAMADGGDITLLLRDVTRADT